MIKNIKTKNKVKKFQKGFALVEVIAALGITALVITALISLSISTLRTSLDSELLLEGTKVANREIELVRAYRDGEDISTGEARSWKTFVEQVAGCLSTPCYMDILNVEPVSGSYTDPPSGGPKAITRQFIATNLNGDPIDPLNPPSVVRISVSVTWKVGDKDKGSYIYTDLSNWRGR